MTKLINGTSVKFPTKQTNNYRRVSEVMSFMITVDRTEERENWDSYRGTLEIFKKLLNFFLSNNIWSENFPFYHKTCFPRKT